MNNDKELIAKYFDKVLTEDEKVLFKEKYAADPVFRQEVQDWAELIKALRTIGEEEKNNVLQDVELEPIISSLKKEPDVMYSTSSPPKPKTLRRFLLFMPLTIVLAFVWGLSYVSYLYEEKTGMKISLGEIEYMSYEYNHPGEVEQKNQAQDSLSVIPKSCNNDSLPAVPKSYKNDSLVVDPEFDDNVFTRGWPDVKVATIYGYIDRRNKMDTINHLSVISDLLYPSSAVYTLLLAATIQDMEKKGDNNESLKFLSPGRKIPVDPPYVEIQWTPLDEHADIDLYLIDALSARIPVEENSVKNYDLNNGKFALKGIQYNSCYFFEIKTDRKTYVFPFITARKNPYTP